MPSKKGVEETSKVINAMVELYLWLGTAPQKLHSIDNLPEGFQTQQEVDGIPRTLHYTDEFVSNLL